MPLRSTVIELFHEIPVVEAGLRQILGAWPEFELRPSLHEAAQATAPPAVQTTPDVLVLDHDRALRLATSPPGARAPLAQVLIVAMDGRAPDVRGALQAGIRGYVMVSCGREEIVRAVRAVAAGHRHLCTGASLHLADKLGQPTLTLREGEVLALVLRGQSNKEMARSLAISEGTVKAHMRTLFSKLGARCRTEALWIASERGLLTRPTPADGAPVRMDERAMTASALARHARLPRLEALPAARPGPRPGVPTTPPTGSRAVPPSLSEEIPCPSPPTPVLHPA